MIRARLFPGAVGDLDRLTAFYERNRSADLPSPTTKDLGDALSSGRLVVAETTKGEILACAAQIPMTPLLAKRYVGELTGTCVTAPVNGSRPIRFHILLLGLRVLHLAATMPETMVSGPTSLLTIVRSSNERSLRGIRACEFVELRRLPRWMKFDELSWHGRYAAGEWTYFHATAGTVRHLAKTLIENGLFDWNLHLENGSGRIEVALDGFHDLRLAEHDIRLMAAGTYKVDFAPPPERIEL